MGVKSSCEFYKLNEIKEIMFLEPYFKGQRNGWIEVICGSMFSGKTEELIRRLKRAVYARQTVKVFKPAIDVRYSNDNVVSHDENKLLAVPVSHPDEILRHMEDIEVVGIDEAQFMDMKLIDVAENLARKGVRVIIAGLDMDYKGVPFGPVPALLAVAEYITKVHAICPHCGNLATHSYRLTVNSERVMLGEKESYEPRCRLCYDMGNILDFRKK